MIYLLNISVNHLQGKGGLHDKEYHDDDSIPVSCELEIFVHPSNSCETKICAVS